MEGTTLGGTNIVVTCPIQKYTITRTQKKLLFNRLPGWPLKSSYRFNTQKIIRQLA